MSAISLFPPGAADQASVALMSVAKAFL